MLRLLLFIFVVAELNCENFFSSERHHWAKQNNIARAILACGESDDGAAHLPDLLALCEVEGDSVLNYLTQRSLLRNAGYRYIVTDSPDTRGINTALLYRPATFTPIDTIAFRITPLPKMRPTRDILYIAGRLQNNDTLHVYVVHAPSRLGGTRSTHKNRELVMGRLAQAVDSLQTLCPSAKIIIAGDFNEDCGASLFAPLSERGLSDISAHARGTHQTGRDAPRGTYKYQGQWEQIDHIFASRSLTEGKRNKRHLIDCHLVDHAMLLTADSEYLGVKPKRGYFRQQWQQGFSDHLPLVAHFAF